MGKIKASIAFLVACTVIARLVTNRRQTDASFATASTPSLSQAVRSFGPTISHVGLSCVAYHLVSPMAEAGTPAAGEFSKSAEVY